MRPLRLATRGSPLALVQARRVAERLAACGVDSEVVVVESGGDRFPDRRLRELGGEGIFVNALERAVLAGKADAACHSAKDLPSGAPLEGLVLAATPERLDPRDALVGGRLDDLPPGALVATGSVRRRAQLAVQRPDLCYTELRGNIATRLGRVPPAGAAIVALAALIRLGLEREAAEVLSPSVMLPQIGQGALAVRCRDDDVETRAELANIDDARASRALSAERAFLATLGGGCDAPVGALARCQEEGPIALEAVILTVDGHAFVRRSMTGDDPVVLGRALGAALAALDPRRPTVPV